MQRYEKYKDSSVDWIGEIPEHWEISKFKSFLTVHGRIGFRGYTVADLVDKGNGAATISPSNMFDGNLNLESSSYLSWEKYYESPEIMVEEGDFLLVKTASIGKLAYVRTLNEKATVNPQILVLKNVSICKTFFFYQLLSSIIQKQLNTEKIGSTIFTISEHKIKNFVSVVPSIVEQQNIATFLDDKTSKIDQTIAIKEKEIELLKERRQILIQKAVTKGLDDTVKLKDSGVDWIGEIPEHWEVRKLKYVSNVVLGKMICNEDKGNYHLKPYLKSKNIQWLQLNLDSIDEMWFSEKELFQYRLTKGDIVVSEGGEVGKATLWNDELPECYIQNSAHKVTLNSYNNNIYHLFCFFVLGKLGVFESVVNKVSIGHLTREKLTNINFPHPSLDEQNEIVYYLEKIEEKIAKAILLKEQEIEKLKEYKMVLIDDVVTGKVRVS